jgi:hypothetical protein
MTTSTFLADDWLAQFNRDIGAEPRGVVLDGGSRLRVRLSDAPPGSRDTLDLDVVDGRPVVMVPADPLGPTDAEATVPHRLFRTMLLEGDMLAGIRAYEDGALVASGRRETLLYFLYHLYPGGPDGAARVATGVNAYTE